MTNVEALSILTLTRTRNRAATVPPPQGAAGTSSSTTLMNPPITVDTIQAIASILGVEARRYGDHYRFEVHHGDANRHLTLEVHPALVIGDETGALVSVFTPSANLQLQHVSGVVVSELLGEITFVAESGGKVSGLIVEKEGACSMYSNVDRSLLSGDFTTMGPEVMMSTLALSLTELILPEEEQAPGGGEE